MSERSPSAAGGPVPLLELDDISRRFGAVQALDRATLRVRPGTVHAVLGENGAGKTTLMRIAFGLLVPDRGTIRIRGRSATVASPAAALQLGIGMVHQHFTLVPAMTVAENVALGGRGRFDPRAAAARVREVASRAGLVVDPDAVVSSLGVGAQQRCEIIKALARDVSLLILDEPTAVLAPQESAELLRWMRAFADDGHAVVLITHKLRDALAVADDVTVLRTGRTVLSVAAHTTSQDALRAAMVGDGAVGGVEEARLDEARLDEARADGARADDATRADDVLAAHHVAFTDARGATRVRDASLSVSGGEIVGIAAIEGSGQHELLRILAGRLEATRGTIARPDSIGFVPEDRHRDALLLDATLTENVALRGAGARTGRVPWRALRDATADVLAARDVRAAGTEVLARTLSGGNQQKLVVGRELAERPRALIVENPSRGLDFQATAAVHRALRDARNAGSAVLLYSSDLDEVLALADRVYVMFAGTLMSVERDRELVGRAMLGAA